MTATTVDRNTVEVWNEGQIIPVALTASTKIPLGVMVSVVLNTGTAINAADTASTAVIGISRQQVDTALGFTKCPVGRGRYWFANGGHITAAHIGVEACVVDNQTVDLAANTTNAIPAGVIIGVDATLGVCIDMAGGKVGT